MCEIQFGISQRTATSHAWRFSGDTIPAEIKTPETGCSSDRETRSFSEQTMAMPCLFGGEPSFVRTVKKVSNAPYSGTKVRTRHQSLSDKLTKSLITSGLVAGTTPSFVRKQFGVAIRDFASLPLDGGDVG